MEFFLFKFSLCRENFCFRIWLLFFWKFHFKLWFAMKKVPTKSCLLKWVRKVNNLLFCAEQIESKPYFLDVMFLSKSDPQWKMNSKSKFQKKNSLSTKRLLEDFFSKSARTKNSRFKNWSFCRKKLHFEIRIFFWKIPFQTLIFNDKAGFKIMPFKISTKSEKNCCFLCSKLSQNVFFSVVNFWSKSVFSIKIELKNWVSGKIFFSKIWLFEKLFILKTAGTKNSQFKTWPFGKFSFQIFIVQGKLLLQNLITFFLKISFQTLIFNKKVCYKVMPFEISR